MNKIECPHCNEIGISSIRKMFFGPHVMSLYLLNIQHQLKWFAHSRYFTSLLAIAMGK